MVTVRTYWNLAQAGFAKTLLDNYEIPCALLDENASCYNSGQQFAVPIRLVVDEHEVDRAISILNNDFENAAEIENAEEAEEIESVVPSETANRNPWELLVVAFYLALPSLVIVGTRLSIDPRGRWASYFAAGITVARFLSWLFLLVAALLVVTYFVVRRSARRVGMAGGSPA